MLRPVVHWPGGDVPLPEGASRETLRSVEIGGSVLYGGRVEFFHLPRGGRLRVLSPEEWPAVRAEARERGLDPDAYVPLFRVREREWWGVVAEEVR